MNSDAIARLKNLAREAASDWREDNDYGDIEDVAQDLAEGIRWSAEGNDWKEGVKHYGGESNLVLALAETMVG